MCIENRPVVISVWSLHLQNLWTAVGSKIVRLMCRTFRVAVMCALDLVKYLHRTENFKRTTKCTRCHQEYSSKCIIFKQDTWCKHTHLEHTQRETIARLILEYAGRAVDLISNWIFNINVWRLLYSSWNVWFYYLLNILYYSLVTCVQHYLISTHDSVPIYASTSKPYFSASDGGTKRPPK